MTRATIGRLAWLFPLILSSAAIADEHRQISARAFSISLPSLNIAKTYLHDGNPNLGPAWERLRRDAAKALQAGPFSVMQKSKIPPSGDKHDYYSIAPYAWPDSSKPDGLPYINRDGRINPDNRIGTDTATFDRMAWNVRTLALAYSLTDNEIYARHSAYLLRTWFLVPATRMNPHLNYGQAIPGRNDGRGAGIIETHPLVDIIDSAGLLESSRAWTVNDRKGMSDWCESYLRWLRTSKFGRKESEAKNNHGTWYDAQVAALALYVGQDSVAREILELSKQRRIDSQIESDGRQPLELARSRSFHYSVFNLRALFTLASLGDRAGVDLWHYQSADGRSLQKALEYLAPYADPTTRWPWPELRMDQSQLVPLLKHAATVFDDESFNRLLSTLPTEQVNINRAQFFYLARIFPKKE